MLEKKIEEAVYTYAVSKGLLHYKFTSPNRRSVPDQLFILPDGIVFFIEFKRTGEKATPPQLREHARLEAQNVWVYVCDDIEQGKKIIDDELWKMKRREDQLT